MKDALREIADNCEPWIKADNMAERLHKIATDALRRDEKPAIVAPIIHLNGSGEQNLIDALANAYSAIGQAAEALKQTAPNGRDYYPAGPEALEAARQQYTRRIRALRDLQDELSEEIYLIEEQGQ